MPPGWTEGREEVERAANVLRIAKVVARCQVGVHPTPAAGRPPLNRAVSVGVRRPPEHTQLTAIRHHRSLPGPGVIEVCHA